MRGENTRRVERERVLSLLYEIDMKGTRAEDVLAELPVEPGQFISETVLGVARDKVEIDGEIERHSIGWSTDRMATLDRSILRMGVWELRSRHDLPVAVIISEAVELAKTFSTDESGKFVNGVLAAAAEDLRN